VAEEAPQPVPQPGGHGRRDGELLGRRAELPDVQHGLDRVAGPAEVDAPLAGRRDAHERAGERDQGHLVLGQLHQLDGLAEARRGGFLGIRGPQTGRGQADEQGDKSAAHDGLLLRV